MKENQIFRPYAIVLNGILEQGLELDFESDKVAIRPHTGKPENFVISPAFVNAHSHLEYRGLQDKLNEPDYWSWIRAITALKRDQDLETVRKDTTLAAHENVRTGVGYIIEHSDRPFAAEALVAAGLHGTIFQEIITIAESEGIEAKLAAIQKKADQQTQILQNRVFPSPHATYTVDRATLAAFGNSKQPLSIHVAETDLEDEFFRNASGPIMDLYNRFGISHPGRARSAVAYLNELGLVRQGVQFVHGCAVDEEDIELMAAGKVTVAHCPRSNTRLGCPVAPVRKMLEAGIKVGIGMDSPASSGPIDMFAEMREAQRLDPTLTAEQVWKMATDPALTSKWIRIHVSGATTTADLLATTPEHVEFV